MIDTYIPEEVLIAAEKRYVKNELVKFVNFNLKTVLLRSKFSDLTEPLIEDIKQVLISEKVVIERDNLIIFPLNFDLEYLFGLTERIRELEDQVEVLEKFREDNYSCRNINIEVDSSNQEIPF